MLKIAFTKSFDMKENQFDIVFIWLEKNDNVFSPQGSVFPTGPFLSRFVFNQVQGPGPGPIFRRDCHSKIFYKVKLDLFCKFRKTLRGYTLQLYSKTIPPDSFPGNSRNYQKKFCPPAPPPHNSNSFSMLECKCLQESWWVIQL